MSQSVCIKKEKPVGNELDVIISNDTLWLAIVSCVTVDGIGFWVNYIDASIRRLRTCLGKHSIDLYRFDANKVEKYASDEEIVVHR